MKVITKKTCASPYGGGVAGTVLDLPQELALAMIRSGNATPVHKQEIERAIDNTPKEQAINVEQYHVGSGYYHLPNGTKVRGRKNAEKALKG